MRLKTRNMRGIKPPTGRLTVLVIIMILACVVFFGRLFHLQFASKEIYDTGFSSANSVIVEVPTVRGEIADVNGKVLVSNRSINSITLNKKQLPNGSENKIVLELSNFLAENSIEYRELLPVSHTYPYVLDRDFSENTEKQKYVRNYARYMGIEYDDLIKTETALYETLLARYGLYRSDYSDDELRLITGLRFTLDVSAYSSNLPCVLVEEADEVTIGKISDSFHRFPGLEISKGTKRVYNIDYHASHLLGRTGPIYAEDADYYREKGYSLNETVGKEGAELAFEEYLRGINGRKQLIMSEDSQVILGEEILTEAKPGYTVRLTIDSEMQQVAEMSLEKVIKEQAALGKRTPGKYDGEDANAGVVVAMDPRDGAVKVLASYPTYNLNTFSEDIAFLGKDTVNTPLVNRATSGLYEPGSTFKIATAAASLYYGVTNLNEVIYDKGEYDFHETYKPHCWIFDSKGITHGYQDMVDAIQNSCNYYFFEMGKRLGIDKINQYAKSLGLGVKTGIETGESSGIMISPQYMEANGLPWNPGYVLQAAIGQQHLFTPVQIASYICAFLNGGKRYKTHIFDSAVDYATGEVIEKYTPEILTNANIPPATVDTLKQAMRRVVDDGTASSTFIGYKYPVGGKTGTAEVPGGSDNVIFVGFAPYDNPELVVTVILEHGDKSSNAAKIARDIFDCYFSRLYPEDFGIVQVNPDSNGTESENTSFGSEETSLEGVALPDSSMAANPHA